ncbi:hypothetical protein MBLNU230_g0084t1 [Neophaeotheca triangularis]
MDERLFERIQSLGDLELAVLLSLASEQHCIVSGEQQDLPDLQEELRIISTKVLGLHTASVQCTAETTVDKFNESILLDRQSDGHGGEPTDHHFNFAKPDFTADFSLRQEAYGGIGTGLDERRVADVIIVRDLDLASEIVQAQVVELIRTKRVFTRTAMHSAPKDIVIIAITSSARPRLMLHLHDQFGFSHYHDPEDGYPRLDDLGEPQKPIFSTEDINTLRTLTKTVDFTVEMASYLHDIVVFLRLSRFVKGGVTGTATRQLRIVTAALAPLHGLTYVTPSIVSLAARKVYLHRLVLATAETERSLQWGSDPEAVREMLKGIGPEEVIQDTIGRVETPL